MFPVSKLHRLPRKTALKKTTLILNGLEIELGRGEALHADESTERYLRSLADFLEKVGPPQDLATAVLRLRRSDTYASAANLLHAVNALRHGLLKILGAEAAEWDLIEPGTGELDAGARRVLPVRVFLEDIRSPFNVGSILRTAEAFGVSHIWLTPATPTPDHPRARRTARGAQASVLWSTAGLEEAAAAGPLFALETGGVPLGEFAFPHTGTVLVGSEELGLSPEALALADRSLGRVSIPLAGAKRSLNVAVAFGILMQWWFSSLE